MGWLRFELGRPTVAGLMGGAMLAFVAAAVPAFVVGPIAFAVGLVAGGLVGAFGLRAARRLD